MSRVVRRAKLTSPGPSNVERKSTSAKMDPRRLALDALVRIEEGAYANVLMGSMLNAAHDLDRRDRAFVTELVYGTTRMRRACDHLVDPFLLRPTDQQTRVLLRMGAYQLHFMKVPAHAAVSATVALAPHRTRGFLNAVLRKVSDTPTRPSENIAIQLSYPDWIVEKISSDLGEDDARDALMQMNEPATVHQRDDGYIQDLGSQWVADAVGVQPGDRVIDVCAAPGGKATAMAGQGARVIAADVSAKRVGLIVENSRRSLPVVVADGIHPPWRPASFDRGLLDAPCSGLGVMRRRPDARWRVQPDDIDRLAALQRELLAATIPLLADGGTLIYSVCTLTNEETLQIDRWLEAMYPELKAIDPLGLPWRTHGRGSLLLPQAQGTDAMYCLRLIVNSTQGLH